MLTEHSLREIIGLLKILFSRSNWMYAFNPWSSNDVLTEADISSLKCYKNDFAFRSYKASINILEQIAFS